MKIIGIIYLTPHFSFTEMCDSLKAGELDILNYPDWDSIVNLNSLCFRLEQVRSLLGLPIIINSGYRSLSLNTAVGGVHNSLHTYGRAADIRCSNMELLRNVLKQFDWVELIDYGTFIHVAI